jgi:hypothetical protein
MSSLRIAAITLLLTMFGAHSVSALSIDTTTGTNADGSAKFDDPDDKIPFPYVADDGTAPSSNFQAQPMGNTGLSFGLTPSNGERDAFQRAQENRQ